MLFVLLKIFRYGYKETKKHKAKKQAQQQQQFQGPYPPHPAYIPDCSQPAYDSYAAGDTTKAPFPTQTEMFSSSAQGTERPKWKVYAELLLQLAQFAFGLAVIGLYGQDINRARARGDSANAKWVYAETVGFLGAVTAGAYLVCGWWWKKFRRASLAERRRLQFPMFVWEGVLVVVWLVLFGIFGEMYIGVYYEGGNGGDPESKVTRMRRAVWVDLASVVFWIASAAWKGMRWWRGKGFVEGVVDEKEMA